MSHLETTPNIACSFHAEHKPLAGNQHTHLIYGSYAHWPTRVLVQAAQYMLQVLAHATRAYRCFRSYGHCGDGNAAMRCSTT
jgi:hypothetical protein